MGYCAKFRGNRSNNSSDMAIFQYYQNGNRPRFWISYEHVWTIRKEYLTVFITVQNFAGIDAVVWIIRKC